MSGAASDIIQVSGGNIYNFAHSPYFADLYVFMDSDPGFEKSSFFINIFELLETKDGRLPFLPGRFSINYAGVNSVSEEAADIFSDYGVIFRKDQIAIYQQSSLDNKLLLSGSFAIRDIILSEEYMNFKDRTCSYDSAGLLPPWRKPLI